MKFIYDLNKKFDSTPEPNRFYIFISLAFLIILLFNVAPITMSFTTIFIALSRVYYLAGYMDDKKY